jgi:hypothetical protein
MRILFIVLTVLFGLAAMGLGSVTASNNLGAEAAEKIAQAEEMMAAMMELAKTTGSEDSAAVAEAKELFEKLGGYRTSGYGGALVSIMTLLVLGVGFTRQEKAAKIIAGASVLVAVIFLIASPSFDTGMTGPGAPRLQAMLFGIPAILAALFSFLAAKKGAANAAKGSAGAAAPAMAG